MLYCLKSVFEKYRFRDGLVWTLGLTVEIKLRHQISPTLCGRGVGSIEAFCLRMLRRKYFDVSSRS